LTRTYDDLKCEKVPGTFSLAFFFSAATLGQAGRYYDYSDLFEEKIWFIATKARRHKKIKNVAVSIYYSGRIGIK
jgi:hypothetical protein